MNSIRFFYLLPWLVLLYSSVFSQALERQFFDKDDRLTDEPQSVYYKTTQKIENENVVKTFYTKSGNRRSQEVLKNGKPVHGGTTEWYDNGLVKMIDSVDIKNQHIEIVYYPSGKVQKIIRPRNIINGGVILNYWDSLGVQIVRDGNGVCKCYDGPGSAVVREEGKLIDGDRDGLWSTYRNDTLLHTDEYAKGKFAKGTSFENGISYPYKAVMIEPSFVGGVDNMVRFIENNLNYPEVSQRNRTTGNVSVEFIIEKDGTLTHVATLGKGISRDCNAESERVVRAMKKWRPAYRRGIPVRSKFVVQIGFHLTR